MLWALFRLLQRIPFCRQMYLLHLSFLHTIIPFLSWLLIPALLKCCYWCDINFFNFQWHHFKCSPTMWKELYFMMKMDAKETNILLIWMQVILLASFLTLVMLLITKPTLVCFFLLNYCCSLLIIDCYSLLHSFRIRRGKLM